MSRNLDFNTLLVPVDFSDNSKAAYAQAISLARGDGAVVILLHVIDPALTQFAVAHGLGSHDEIMQQARARADTELQQYVNDRPEEVEVEQIVSEGAPFFEILRTANDFAVDAIVMSKAGERGDVEDLLFGSTAEKVLRGSTKPVLVLPSSG